MGKLHKGFWLRFGIYPEFSKRADYVSVQSLRWRCWCMFVNIEKLLETTFTVQGPKCKLFGKWIIALYWRNPRRSIDAKKKKKWRYFYVQSADPGFQRSCQRCWSKSLNGLYDDHYIMDKILDRAQNWIKFISKVRRINDAQLLRQTRFRMPSAIGA